jgi:hypothetical protein
MNTEMLVAIEDEMLDGVSGGHAKEPVDPKPKHKDHGKDRKDVKRKIVRRILGGLLRRHIC